MKGRFSSTRSCSTIVVIPGCRAASRHPAPERTSLTESGQATIEVCPPVSRYSAFGPARAVLERGSGLQEWQVLDGDLPFPARLTNVGFVPHHVIAEGQLPSAGKPELSGKDGGAAAWPLIGSTDRFQNGR